MKIIILTRSNDVGDKKALLLLGITCGLPDRVESPACQAKSYSRWIWNNNNVFIDLFSLSSQNKILSCFCILCLRILLSKFIVITITESNVPSQQQGHIQTYIPRKLSPFRTSVILLFIYLLFPQQHSIFTRILHILRENYILVCSDASSYTVMNFSRVSSHALHCINI